MMLRYFYYGGQKEPLGVGGNPEKTNNSLIIILCQNEQELMRTGADTVA